MSDLVLRENHHGAAILTLNRPDKMNALNKDVFEALEPHDANPGGGADADPGPNFLDDQAALAVGERRSEEAITVPELHARQDHRRFPLVQLEGRRIGRDDLHAGSATP